MRYLLVVGAAPGERDAIARRVGIAAQPPSLDADAPLVFADAPPIMHRCGEGRNVQVLGDIHPRSQVGPKRRGQAAAGDGRLLHQTAWGSYLAITEDGAEVSVSRDPSGALPCYYRQSRGMVAVASDLTLIEAALPLPRRLDWDEIARLLGANDLRTARTGLRDVTELLPGHRLRITPTGLSTVQDWSPWDRHGPDLTRADPDELATLLRCRIDEVMDAVARSHPHAVVRVSGGLDSSIVALAYGARSADMTCVTLATDAPGGDERRYARLIAAAAGARCYEERILDGETVDLRASRATHLPRPGGRSYMAPVEAILADVATQAKSTAILNGTGGDHVFCFLQSATPVIDRLISQGPWPAWRTTRDVADLTQASYAEVLLAAGRRLSRLREGTRWIEDHRLLAGPALHDRPQPAHPWLDGDATGRPGRLAQVTMLLRIQNYCDPWTGVAGPVVLNPLLAQPIVECCLSIPTWEWVRGGRDRAVVRRAYARELPQAIAERRWKGGPDSFVSKLVEGNRPLIRSLLADGMLAGRGIVDRSAIGAVLADPRPVDSSLALRLLFLTDVEAWLRQMG